MISVREAITTALEKTRPLDVEEVDILKARGSVLAEDVISDIDMPPFEKAMMDGYAFRALDWQTGKKFRVVGTIAAGTAPDFRISSGEAAKIMTGAPLPEGADSVQMVEKTRPVEAEEVEILESVPQGKHVASRGEIMSSGNTVISHGTYISPAVIGALATVGKSKIKVVRRPSVAILVTGDELVAIDQAPAKGQIRNSNGYALYHQVAASGAHPVVLGIASDDPNKLREKIETGLNSDMLLISGGVSMGEFDLVENVLEDVGVEIHYEKVNIKPGKPTVFATHENKHENKPVFGLPGNPVSASTVFEVIVTPVLRKMMGFSNLTQAVVKATLMSKLQSKTRRENYLPAFTTGKDGEFMTEPVASKGSADILAFARSNSFIIAAPELDFAEEGHVIQVVLREEFWKNFHSGA